MVGDAVGRTGRQTVTALLPALRRELDVDLVIANGENAAAGRGITPP
jgi:calcineurin-like phosphoesterase